MVVRRGLPGTRRDGIIQRKAADPYVLVPLGGSLGKPEVVLRLRSLMDAKLVGQGRHPHASNIRLSDISLYAEIFPILQHKIDSAFGMGIFTDTMGAFEYGASPRVSALTIFGLLFSLTPLILPLPVVDIGLPNFPVDGSGGECRSRTTTEKPPPEMRIITVSMTKLKVVKFVTKDNFVILGSGGLRRYLASLVRSRLGVLL